MEKQSSKQAQQTLVATAYALRLAEQISDLTKKQQTQPKQQQRIR